MVDQLNAFASEVSRVAREVGTEGKLGGQAAVPGVAGTWKDLTDNVNSMASNLTGQVRNIADVATAIAKRRPVAQDHRRRQGRDPAAEEHHQHDGRPAERLRVGSQPRRARGRHRRQAGRPGEVPDVAGTWKDLTDNVNSMASNLTGQVRNIADVATAIANGDLSRKITVDVKGEILELKNTDQHDGRSAQRLRLGSDARRARSRHRRQARRPGGRHRRRRHVEGPDRQRQLHGLEPDRPGAQHRRGRDRRRPRRPVAQDHGRREGRDSRAEEHHQHDGRPAERLRLGSQPRRARGRHRRQARRPGASSPASPAPGRTSPTTSTRWPAT